MLTRKNVIALMLFVLSINTWAQTLIVSKDIRLDLPDAISIAHSGELLLKYPDWNLSHETLNPKTFYPSVDLTGLLGTYVRNIFEPKDGELPKWLQVMAKEQSIAFNSTDNNKSQFSAGVFTVYTVFDSDNNIGHVFLIADDYVSHFNVLSNKEKFLDFVGIIKRSL